MRRSPRLASKAARRVATRVPAPAVVPALVAAVRSPDDARATTALGAVAAMGATGFSTTLVAAGALDAVAGALGGTGPRFVPACRALAAITTATGPHVSAPVCEALVQTLRSLVAQPSQQRDVVALHWCLVAIKCASFRNEDNLVALGTGACDTAGAALGGSRDVDAIALAVLGQLAVRDDLAVHMLSGCVVGAANAAIQRAMTHRRACEAYIIFVHNMALAAKKNSLVLGDDLALGDEMCDHMLGLRVYDPLRWTRAVYHLASSDRMRGALGRAGACRRVCELVEVATEEADTLFWLVATQLACGHDVNLVRFCNAGAGEALVKVLLRAPSVAATKAVCDTTGVLARCAGTKSNIRAQGGKEALFGLIARFGEAVAPRVLWAAAALWEPGDGHRGVPLGDVLRCARSANRESAVLACEVLAIMCLDGGHRAREALLLAAASYRGPTAGSGYVEWRRTLADPGTLGPRARWLLSWLVRDCEVRAAVPNAADCPICMDKAAVYNGACCSGNLCLGCSVAVYCCPFCRRPPVLPY